MRRLSRAFCAEAMFGGGVLPSLVGRLRISGQPSWCRALYSGQVLVSWNFNFRLQANWLMAMVCVRISCPFSSTAVV